MTEVSDDIDGSPAVRTLSVPEMDCPSCAEKVGGAIAGVEGVTGHEADPTAGTVRIEYDPGAVDTSGLVASVEGFRVERGPDGSRYRRGAATPEAALSVALR